MRKVKVIVLMKLLTRRKVYLSYLTRPKIRKLPAKVKLLLTNLRKRMRTKMKIAVAPKKINRMMMRILKKNPPLTIDNLKSLANHHRKAKEQATHNLC